MARLQRVPAWAALAALVVVSTGLRSLAAWEVDTPWIAPDEIIYSLLGRSLWESGTLSILGADTGFYSLLYPALVGGPFSFFEVETARQLVQVLQAFVVSCTAIPVYLWGRTLARRRHALGAAALTLALPGLGYSALVMSEVLFLPLVTLALWALARALERPTLTRQVLLAVAIVAACATRLQALVLVPTLIAAVLLKGVLDRDRRIVWRFGALLGGLATLAAVLVLAARERVLGAYAAAGRGGYDLDEAATFVATHAAGILLICGIVPAIALALVALPALRGREPSEALRAFLAVALAYLPLLALEVGVFASREIGHLAGRDLLTAAPVAILGFAVWIDRGAPRSQPTSGLIVLGAGVLLLALPKPRTVTAETVHDTLALVWLEQLSVGSRELAYTLVAALALASVALVPRRGRALLAGAVLVALAAASGAASFEAVEQSRFRESSFLGSQPTWVDDTGLENVAFLYAGEPRSTIAWLHVYWNRSITEVWALGGRFVPGPLPQRAVFPRDDGSLESRGAGSATAVVAPTSLTLFGTRVAEIPQRETLDAGLVLWQTDEPARLSTLTAGVRANGDFDNAATLTAFACDEGRLELTLLGKSGNPLELRLDGITRRVVELPGGAVWRGTVETLRYATEDGICLFELVSEGLVGSTRLEFVRG